MRKLAVLSVLFLGFSLSSLWSKPAMAYVYPPCDEFCHEPAGRCSCPFGSLHPSQNTTCDQWEYFCYV